MEALVEKLIRDRLNLEDHIKAALVHASLEVAERLAKDHGISCKHLREKYVDPVIHDLIRKEFLPNHTKRTATCKGSYSNRMPCTKKALANGFCKAHADQYESYHERQRVIKEMQQQRRVQHTHAADAGLVDGCPACDAIRKRNPFVENRRLHGLPVLSSGSVV